MSAQRIKCSQFIAQPNPSDGNGVAVFVLLRSDFYRRDSPTHTLVQITDILQVAIFIKQLTDI